MSHKAKILGVKPGQTRYESEVPCQHCGGTTRRVCDRRCVVCAREKKKRRPGTRQAKQRRRAARRAAGLTYEGRPCATCGSTTRYALNEVCITCIRQTPEEKAARALWARTRRFIRRNISRNRLRHIRAATAYRRACSAELGLRTFDHHRACRHCGSHERMVRSQWCPCVQVQRVRKASQQRRRRKNKARGPETPAEKAEYDGVYHLRDVLNQINPGGDPWVVDHIESLSNGGEDRAPNLRVIRSSENNRKGNRDWLALV